MRDLLRFGQAFLTFPQRLFRLLLRGDVGDEPLQKEEVILLVILPLSALPHPFQAAVFRGEAVGHFIRSVCGSGHLRLFPDPFLVVFRNQLIVDDAPADELFRRVAGQREAAIADECHRPVLVIFAPIHHAGNIAHDSRKLLLALAQRFFRADAPGNVVQDGDHGAFIRHCQRAEIDADRQAAAIFAQPEQFHRRGQSLLIWRRKKGMYIGGAIRQQRMAWLADQFLARIAEHLF